MTPPVNHIPREICGDIKVELDIAVEEGYLTDNEAARIFRKCFKNDWGPLISGYPSVMSYTN